MYSDSGELTCFYIQLEFYVNSSVLLHVFSEGQRETNIVKWSTNPDWLFTCSRSLALTAAGHSYAPVSGSEHLLLTMNTGNTIIP